MYRSKFEANIAKWLQAKKIKFKYEPCKLNYIVPESKHKYTPDWHLDGDRNIYYESKGKLTAADRKKLLHIKESNPNLTIRIILMNSDVKIRKGSPTTYGDWCTKSGFEWCDWRHGGIPKKWMKQ